MLEILEKTAMAALGAAAITQKKVEELVVEMRDKYRISEDEGKLYVDRIQALVRESREKVREVAEAEVRGVVDRLGLVTRDEFERLQKRVQVLESRQDS